MKKINTNGQKVFVEPSWVTGETCLFGIKNQVSKLEFAHIQKRLQELREEVLRTLISEGYIITYDKTDTDNVVSFIMNDEAITLDDDMVDYKREFDQRMFTAGGETLHYPFTLSFYDYLKNPFFPAVLKNEVMNGGIDKFLITSEEQVSILKKLLEDKISKPGYKEMFDSLVCQQFIKNPEGYKSYIRVLMSASGEVMGASLKYTKEEKIKKEPSSPLEKILLTPTSPYYLNCETMFNYYANGGSISFYQPKYSTLTSKVLKDHNIDPTHPEIPEDVLTSCKNIMKKCNRELGIMVGFDFIYNDLDKTWYYLENQAFPAIDEWLVKNGSKPLKVNSTQDMLMLFALEATARIESLHSYTLNKKETITENKHM